MVQRFGVYSDVVLINGGNLIDVIGNITLSSVYTGSSPVSGSKTYTMTTILKFNEDYKLVHYSNTIKFQGCQCTKDCTCREDYKSWTEEYYRVVPTDTTKGKGQKFYRYEQACKIYNQLSKK